MTQSYVQIGAGGTGSIVLPYLYRHATKMHDRDFTITVVDGDEIEDRNVVRQGYRPDDIGKFKADVLTRRYPERVRYNPRYLTADNADQLIAERDIVIIAADNWPVRADIERRALELDNVTIINGGNEATTATCQIFARRGGDNLTPPLSYMHPEILTPDLNREQESCLTRMADPDDAQTVGANLMSAAWIIAAVYHVEQRLSTLAGNGIAWHEVHADLLRGTAGGPDWRDMGSDAWRTYVPPVRQQEEVTL